MWCSVVDAVSTRVPVELTLLTKIQVSFETPVFTQIADSGERADSFTGTSKDKQGRRPRHRREQRHVQNKSAPQ